MNNGRHQASFVQAGDRRCCRYGDYQLGWGIGSGVLLSSIGGLVQHRDFSGDDWNDVVRTLHTPAGELTARYKSSNRGLPGLEVEHFVKSLDDIECIGSIPYEPLQVDASGFFTLDEMIGERGVVMCSIANPLYTFAMLMGSELLAIWSIEQRDMINEWIATLTERTCDVADRQIAAGVGPVFGMLGENHPAPALGRDFREFCVEPEKQSPAVSVMPAAFCHPLPRTAGRHHEDFIELGSDVRAPSRPRPRQRGDRGRQTPAAGGLSASGQHQIGDIYAAPT